MTEKFGLDSLRALKAIELGRLHSIVIDWKQSIVDRYVPPQRIYWSHKALERDNAALLERLGMAEKALLTCRDILIVGYMGGKDDAISVIDTALASRESET